VDIVFDEFELRVEGVVPDYFNVINDRSVIFIPIKMFAHEQGESEVHLYGGNVFVDDVNVGLIVTDAGNFISELCDFGHGLSKG